VRQSHKNCECPKRSSRPPVATFPNEVPENEAREKRDKWNLIGDFGIEVRDGDKSNCEVEQEKSEANYRDLFQQDF